MRWRFESTATAAAPEAPEADAIEALWVRAKHHEDKLHEAWAWVESRGMAHLSPAAAGVADLIAVA